MAIPIFKGDEKSFPFWKRRMEQHLKQEDLLHTVLRTPEEEDFAHPLLNDDAEAEDERQRKYAHRLKEEDRAVNELCLALEDDAMAHVFDCVYAKQIMAKLREIYQPSDTVAMLGLRKQLYNLGNKQYKSLKDLFDAHDEICRQLEGTGEVMQKADKINTLLVAIPERFKHVISALSVVRKEELEAMSMEQIKSLFFNEERTKGTVQAPVAMIGQKKTIKCFECGKIGHKQRNCFVLKKKQKSESQKNQQEKSSTVNVAMLARQEGAFMVRVPLSPPNSHTGCCDRLP